MRSGRSPGFVLGRVTTPLEFGIVRLRGNAGHREILMPVAVACGRSNPYAHRIKGGKIGEVA
jgi:hypothetical protein